MRRVLSRPFWQLWEWKVRDLTGLDLEPTNAMAVIVSVSSNEHPHDFHWPALSRVGVYNKFSVFPWTTRKTGSTRLGYRLARVVLSRASVHFERLFHFEVFCEKKKETKKEESRHIL